MRLNPFISICIGLCLLVSCSNKPTESIRIQTVKLDTIKAASEQTALQFPGKVKAAKDVNLSFRVSGTINRILVDEGASVREGQLLAELDATDYQMQLDATEAEYMQIKAEAERVMTLYKEEVTSQSDNDKARYGLKQITAKYKHHQDEVAYTKLYAPFSGYIQKRLFEVHETVGAGMPVVSMIGGGMPEVEISLPAAEYIRLKEFSSYQCTFDVYPGKTYPLKFISVSPKANANQLYTMRLQLTSGNEPVPSPGMNTMVTIFSSSDKEGILTVPASALLHKNEKSYVFVFDTRKGVVKQTEVIIKHLFNDGSCTICSETLQPGLPIVASGVHHIEDGEKVEPLPTPCKTNIGGLL